MTKQEAATRLLVSAPPEVIQAIDLLVEASPVRTSRSAVALAAIETGLRELSKRMTHGATARKK